MIDLKELIERYPDCLDNELKLRSYLTDLYPNEKARISILTTIFSSGIADEIKKEQSFDELTISKYCQRLSNKYAYSLKEYRECLIILIEFFQIESIIRYVNESLAKVYLNDSYLIHFDEKDNISTEEKHVGERTVQFRFAYYLQQLLEKDVFFKNVVVDCEYNRHIYEVKQNNAGKNVIPDVIIHERGTDNNNLLFIELKTWWNKDITEDKKKVMEFTDQKGLYRYAVGMSITFEKEYEETVKNTVLVQSGQVLNEPSNSLKKIWFGDTQT